MFIHKKNRVPFFSITLATYNRAYVLERAINSVINQKEKDWELLIIDDGSQDDTYKVCSKYFGDNRIRYFFHTNRGLSLTRNVGILSSAGVYITFLDSDDEYKDDHLLIRKQILMQNPDVDLLYGGIEIIGNPYVPDFFNKSNLIHIDNCYVGGTFFIRKEVALQLDGFRNIPYGDDFDFATRAIAEGFTVASVEYKTYIYHRETTDSICNNIQNYMEAK